MPVPAHTEGTVNWSWGSQEQTSHPPSPSGGSSVPRTLPRTPHFSWSNSFRSYNFRKSPGGIKSQCAYVLSTK